MITRFYYPSFLMVSFIISKLIHLPLPEDDPIERKPDINKAIQYLKWEPKIDRLEGLSKTIEYFRKVI